MYTILSDYFSSSIPVVSLLLLAHGPIARRWVLRRPHVHRVWDEERTQIGVRAHTQVESGKVEINVKLGLEAHEIWCWRGHARVPILLQYLLIVVGVGLEGGLGLLLRVRVCLSLGLLMGYRGGGAAHCDFGEEVERGLVDG